MDEIISIVIDDYSRKTRRETLTQHSAPHPAQHPHPAPHSYNTQPHTHTTPSPTLIQHSHPPLHSHNTLSCTARVSTANVGAGPYTSHL